MLPKELDRQFVLCGMELVTPYRNTITIPVQEVWSTDGIVYVRFEYNNLTYVGSGTRRNDYIMEIMHLSDFLDEQEKECQEGVISSTMQNCHIKMGDFGWLEKIIPAYLRQR